MNLRLRHVSLLGLALHAGCSRDPSAPRASTSPGLDADTLAAPPAQIGNVYAGRPIAIPLGFEGAGWMERPEREETEQPEKVLDALALSPGAAVADVGAGTGYFTLRLARRVGPLGHVLATDLDPRSLTALREHAAAEHLTNIETRVVTGDDPRLDPASLDLVLMVDVYHELAHPAAELAAVRAALRPGGRLVLVEYRAEDPALAILPRHKMTRAQVEAEVLPAGYREIAVLEFLRDQRVLVFSPAGR